MTQKLCNRYGRLGSNDSSGRRPWRWSAQPLPHYGRASSPGVWNCGCGAMFKKPVMLISIANGIILAGQISDCAS